MINSIPIPTAIIDTSNKPFKIIECNSFFISKFPSFVPHDFKDSSNTPHNSTFFSENDSFGTLIIQVLATNIQTTQEIVVPYQTHFLKVTFAPYPQPDTSSNKKQIVLYFEEIPSIYSNPFQLVIETIEGIFWKADASTLEFTYISPQVQRILGYTPSQWLESPHFWTEHIHEEDRESVVTFCRQQSESGMNHSIEYRMLAANGTVIWVKDAISIIHLENGSTQLIGLMTNVNEKKIEEEQLLTKKNQLKMLLKSAREGLFGLNREGRCTFINDAAAKMLGFPKEEFLGNMIHPFIHPTKKMRETHKKKNCSICDTTLLTLKREHQLERFYRADGSQFDVRYSSVPLFEKGKNIGVVVTFADITEQLESNRKLLHSKKTLNKILEQSLDLICTFDREGHFINVSQASMKILGYKPTELIGEKYTDFLIPEDLHTTLKIGKLVMRGGSKSNFENRYIRKDGSVVSILWSARWDQEEELMYCTGKDATELNDARARLELSERRFRQLVKGSNDIIAILDQKGKCLYVSQTSNPLLGYSAEEFTGQIAFDHIHRDEVTAIRTIFTNLPLDTIVLPPLFRFRHKNGNWRWMESSLKNLSNDEAVGGIVANLRDVTERIQASQLIEKSNERYTYVMRATFDAIRDWEICEDHIHWGDGLHELFGHIPDSQNEKLSFWLENIHPEDSKRVEQSLKTAIESGDENWRIEYRFKQANGLYAYVADKSILIRNSDGKAIRLVGAIQDITSKKTEELRLKLLESVIVNMTDAVLVIRIDETENGEPMIVYCNNAFSEMTGYSPSEVYGKSPLFFDSPDRHLPIVKELYNAYNNKKNFECELEYNKKSGEPIWLNIVLNPIIEKDGQCNHFIVIERDITERKKAELELKNLYEELELHAKKLTISNFELEQFAYVASHDLQEPLRMVTSFLTLLEKRYADKLDDKAREFIFFAVDGATRMRQIILDLLDYSRIGKGEISIEDIDLNELLDEVWDTFQTRVKETSATLIIKAPLPKIRSYQTPIRQVFQNLISNSLKYIPRDRKPVIIISYHSEPDFYEFFVKDNGIGIHEMYYEKIFNIFLRLHTKEEYGGTGMGLAITKKIVEGLGGTISVKSIENQESTFIFTIPKNTLH